MPTTKRRQSLSAKILAGKATPAEHALADAAPDMLEACRLALATMEEWGWPDTNPAKPALRAALAKAVPHD